ncbi:hypothetical protein ACGF1Z_13960 [Streptomyces sp. NPDC048018]|uniref:hypothetical protein n=1 Tax=Streptomyces sp. NPDC048018 TaxID=3365499 RepID=UPI00372183C8
MDHPGRLAPGGLVFLGLVDQEVPLVPPTIATVAADYPPPVGEWARSVVETTAPDFVARANEGWFALARDGGLFGDDREFLVAVEVEGEEERNDWWWARVRLDAAWDVMGAGAASALGVGPGAPEFAMLSVSGDVIVCGTTGPTSIGTVLVTGFRELAELREFAEWQADWSGTPQRERVTTRRWLNSSGD